MTITYTKTRNITGYPGGYTAYEVLRDGIVIGYVENQKSGPYANWKPFLADRRTPAHPCVHGTRKDAVRMLLNAVGE